MKRREAFSLIPLTIAGTAGMIDTALSQDLRHDTPMVDEYHKQPVHHGSLSPEPLAIRYTKKVRDMLLWIRETQSENLLEASYAIARTVKNGDQCWCSWDMGHSTKFDIFPGRNGVPEIFIMGYDTKKTKKGDLFLASIWGGPHDDLVNKAISVIGGPAPWGGDAKGYEPMREDIEKRKMRPYSHIWIETNITRLGAVNNIPGSFAPFGPVSGIIGIVTYWMMLADACRILARDGKSLPVRGDEPKLSGENIPWVNLHDPLMDDYFDQIMLQIEMIEAEMGNIRRIAEMAVDSVLDGGKVWCYSRHWDSLAAEGHIRRGGLFLTRGLYEKDGEPTTVSSKDRFDGSSKDLVIMGIWKPDDEIDLKNLDIFRRSGMKVVSIGPMLRNIKIPEGRTVPKETDVHVGRMCDTYGMYAVPGFERKICPTSGALIMQIFWTTCAEIAEQIIRRTGNVPSIGYNGALLACRLQESYTLMQYKERGY